jgi:hypothetical protein
MHAIRSLPCRSLYLAVTGLALLVSPASALSIFYRSTGELDFSENPIPADFFGPGSLPFEGHVPLLGIPFGPAGTDTIVERGPVTGGLESVPIQIVALELKSIAPIEVNFGTASSFFDVFVELEPAPPSNGQMQLQQTSPSGGLIVDSFFDIFYDIDFLPVGPGAPQTMPQSESMNLELPPVPFLYSAPPEYPGSAGFYPELQQFDGPGPLELVWTTPEPSSFLLASCGLALVALFGSRMRRIRG